MNALLTVYGVRDHRVTIRLPHNNIPSRGYVRGPIPEGFDALISFPDGVGFVESLEPSEHDGYEVVVGAL